MDGSLLLLSDRLRNRIKDYSILGALSGTVALGAVWFELHRGWIMIFGAGAVAGLVAAAKAARASKLQRALGIELEHGQRDQLYDVKVFLNPSRSLRVTELTATIECVQLVAVSEPYSGGIATERRPLFTVSQTLFQGSVTLGHGEDLGRSATLQLPAELRVFQPDPLVEVERETMLIIRVQVDGVPFFEHSEGATVDLPFVAQETLSQM